MFGFSQLPVHDEGESMATLDERAQHYVLQLRLWLRLWLGHAFATLFATLFVKR